MLRYQLYLVSGIYRLIKEDFERFTIVVRLSGLKLLSFEIRI